MTRSAVRSLAVCTAVYPGVEPFLGDWCRSLRAQSDQDFTLWIGLDTLSVDAAVAAMGWEPRATWLAALPGDTPAQVRQRVMERLVEECDAVVLVDADDIMHPSRVASARETLRGCDLAGCAMRLVDRRGGDLGLTLGVPPGALPEEVLPRNNIFGLSNSAFRCATLRRCLPIPAEVALVDWYLATRAWLTGAHLSFDAAARMDYRQHGGNMVRVRPPFEAQQVKIDSERVLHHLRVVLSSSPAGARGERLKALEEAAREVASFHRQVALHPEELEKYLEALNDLAVAPLWWSSVAHPALRTMWTPLKETT